MDEKPFDWFEDTMEVEASEFHPQDPKRGVYERFFDITVTVCVYVSTFCGVLWLVRYVISSKRIEIGSTGIDTILISFFFHYGSICIITNIMRFFTFVVKRLGSDGAKKLAQLSFRPIALSFWYIFNLYALPYVKYDLLEYYKIVKAYLQSGLLTCLTFTAVNISLDYFSEYFIEKSLLEKLREVEMKERILAAMKNYRYELADSSSTSAASRECTFRELFWFGEPSEEENEEHIELRKWDQEKVGNLNLKAPEVQSLFDAKTLARDVFDKAAEGANSLDFNHFSKIFPNDQIALQSLPFFEANDDQIISKKEFRNTIVQFFVDRVNLEKNYNITKGFVKIIGDIVKIVVFGFLILAYLVLFGIPLKELVALALSSALFLNFLVSGAASEMYFNLMFLLSHPYDVGDDIIVNGTDYKVYKIGLTCSSFLLSNGGKVKFLNSVLFKMTVVNMTRAPEKIIAFDFKLDPNLDIVKFQLLKAKIQKYLRERQHDYFETFSLQSKSESDTLLKALECSLILKCRSYKNKTKKFNLRVEVTHLMQELFLLLDIKQL